MLTLSKHSGTGGSIKGLPEDFLVEEITTDGTVLEIGRKYPPETFAHDVTPEARFTTFILQKKNWNTVQALKVIAKKFARGIKSTAFAGTKDRNSISTQLCSIFKVPPERVVGVHIKDIEINGAWQSQEALKLGNLLGNRFTINIREVKDQSAAPSIDSELSGIFPNYFGSQRFGSRKNNVNIGVDIIKGNFEGAAMTFLTDYQNETNQEAIDARKRLGEERDFAHALQYFPSYLKYERAVIEHLSTVPTDFAGALRKLPRSLSLMFVHAVDSYIFNKEVEDRLRYGSIIPGPEDTVCSADKYGFPDFSTCAKASAADSTGARFIVGNIVGYDSGTTPLEDKILEELGIKKEEFKVSRMPELNCKGSRRVLFAPYMGFTSTQIQDSGLALKFSLPSGSYATVFLDEFLKGKE